MVDWTSTMQQTFEYYIVDPETWKDSKKLNTVISSKISRDLEAETLGSASITISESIGECYIRIYLITIQNRKREKHPLGTFLIQTPSYSFDGKVKTISTDAYTPLLELKEKNPPIGYSIYKNENILDRAYEILRNQMRAPIVRDNKDVTINENFVANLDDTWITFIIDLLDKVDMQLSLDELGRVLFSPKQDLKSLQPIWTFNADNSSILYPNFDIDNDLYGIPNVVEVVYSNASKTVCATAVNDDKNSPVSTVNRGRRIVNRITNPSIVGNPSEKELKTYAEKVLKQLSSIEYTITFSHGYCPIRIGDCVRLNYESAGLRNVKAKIISQSISCTPGCPVSSKAVFTSNLWGGE